MRAVPRISVVVPVYNVERYLSDCLESIERQTVTDLEVLVVDDGSTDGSAAIPAAFAARDPRFRIITQPNGGRRHPRHTHAAPPPGHPLPLRPSGAAAPADAPRPPPRA